MEKIGGTAEADGQRVKFADRNAADQPAPSGVRGWGRVGIEVDGALGATAA